MAFNNEQFNELVRTIKDLVLGVGIFCARTHPILVEYLDGQDSPTESELPVEPVIEEPPVVEEPPVIPYIESTWTGRVDSQYVYVSKDGNDNNIGSATLPIRSIAKGLSLLRNGKPDRLLFKRGDVWTNEGFDNIELSGQSAAAPMVFGSYGDVNLPRPKFDTGSRDGLNTFPKGSPPREPLSLNYLAFVGLHFCASERNPSSINFTGVESKPTGFRFLRGTQGLTIDDCKFEYYHTNIIIQNYSGAGISNVLIKNSCILNAYAYSPESGHSQGIYTDGVDGLTIADCIIDNNGHNDNAPKSEPTIFNHNLYIQKTCKNVSVLRNIITRASSHGCQIRPGGIVTSNFFYRNPINLLVGYDDPLIQAHVEDNVIAEGTNISENLPRVWGIEFKGQNPPGVAIHNNICVNALDLSPNSRSIEDKSNVHYMGNITYGWPPNGRFNNISATYLNPNVDMGDAGITPGGFYALMRIHSMDSKQLSASGFITMYRNAFTGAEA